MAQKKVRSRRCGTPQSAEWIKNACGRYPSHRLRELESGWLEVWISRVTASDGRTGRSC